MLGFAPQYLNFGLRAYQWDSREGTMQFDTRIPFFVGLLIVIAVMFYLLLSRDSDVQPQHAPASEQAQPITPLPELPQQ
jgi:hypothetical protein